MAGEQGWWDDNSFWEDSPTTELTDADVIIENETPMQTDFEQEDNDEEFYQDLMNFEPNPALEKAKSDPTLNGWVPMETPSKTNVTDNARYAFDYLNKKGLPQHVSAGIVGNLMKESGVNPNIRDGDRRGGIGGIAQWDPHRSAQLKAFAQASGRSPKDLNTQLDFVVHEADQRGDLERTKQASTPEEAAVIFGRRYEKPNEKYADWNQRAAYAKGLIPKGQYGKVTNIPDYGPIGPPVYDEYELEEQPVQDKNSAPEVGEASPVAGAAATAVTGAVKVMDAVSDGRSKIAKLADNISKSTSDAIAFQSEIAGASRNAQTLRKFKEFQNRPQFAPVRTNQNQPVIYE